MSSLKSYVFFWVSEMYLEFAELEPEVLLGVRELLELQGEQECGLVEFSILLIVLAVVLLYVAARSTLAGPLGVEVLARG
jgi:hypothetical protein